MSTQPLTGPEPLGCDECYDPGCPGVAAQEEAFEARFEAEASLTPAEAAVVAVLSGESDCSWHIGCDEECHVDRARAVVAAVRPIVENETLEATADKLDELAASSALVGRGTAEGPWIAAGVQGAALAVRRQVRARQSLSRPTSEETDR